MTRAIVFDLDGTLSDPKRGMSRCLTQALTTLGRPAPTSAELDAMIGPPLQQSLEKLVGPELAPEAIRLYRLHYDQGGWSENDPYPGVAKMLADCRKFGAPLYVVTSKLEVFARRIVAYFGWDDVFSGVFGELPDDIAHDKARLLAQVKNNHNLSAGVMIGDRLFDCRAAKANAFKSIGVLWGYGARAELEQAGCDVLAATPGEVPSLCQDLFTAERGRNRNEGGL